MSVRRHLGFGSTPRFSQLRKEVKGLTDNADRLAYAEYDPSLGVPPTDIQKAKLEEYVTPLPTLTFKGSEKLHGENMAVAYSNGELWVQGRNHVRTLLGDQNGMAHFVETTKSAWLSIISTLQHTYNVNTDTHTIVLDCEWAGGNIQKGNAACSGTDKAAYLFDYFKVVSNEDDSIEYLPTQDVGNPSIGIYNMASFTQYVIELDFNNPVECEEQLKVLAEQIEDNSPIAKHFDKPANVGEGAYLWSEYNGTMLRLKTKGEKHGGKPKVPRQPKTPLTDSELIAIDALATAVTPVWRLTQAITEANATETKHIGEVIKWVMTDIAKEESEVIAASGIEFKMAQGTVVKIIKDYYFDSIKGY